jgi:DNA-binding NtrC family response regulator
MIDGINNILRVRRTFGSVRTGRTERQRAIGGGLQMIQPGRNAIEHATESADTALVETRPPPRLAPEGDTPAEALSLLRGTSLALTAVRDSLPLIARVQRTTLVVGATGTGKDLVARSLHQLSLRRERPFVTVHCAALPESLVEAEMFGHCRGAFTGATQSRAGLIRTASQGTLFLDEIDSLPASAQAKLLRFLETGEYRAVGSDRVEHSDAWVIAATNQDLNRRVQEGTFRADLLYRLAVLRVDLPALSDRPADILFLARLFLAGVGRGDKEFSGEAQAALLAHPWPGNVRELKHRVESAALLTEAPVISDAALGLTFGQRALAQAPAPQARLEAAPPPPPLDTLPLERELWTLIARNGLTLSAAVDLCEQLMIHAALQAEGNNRTRAANRLGIHVRTIFKKLIPPR